MNALDNTQTDSQPQRQTYRQTESVGVGVVCGVWCGVTHLGAVLDAVSGKHGVGGLVARCCCCVFWTLPFGKLF